MSLRHWFCRHAHSYRERDDLGVLFFVCHHCAHRVQVIARTDEERDEMREAYRLPLPASARKVSKRKLAVLKQTVAAFPRKAVR